MAKERKKLAVKQKEKLKESETPDEDKKKKVKEQERSAASMLEFLEKARNGEMVPPEVIIQFATLFQDDLTLDQLPRMQLINMCKYMNIPPYGSDPILRFQLRHHIRTLKEDDQRILWEGIDSLTKMELREACQERGMRSTGMSKSAYKLALQQWLDLSVNKNVPISLLIMSRTFFLREEMTVRVPGEDDGSHSVNSLADAISGLDKDVVNEVVLEIATPEEVQRDPGVRRIKLEVLESQNERILEEQIEREATSKKKEQSEGDAQTDKAAEVEGTLPTQEATITTTAPSLNEESDPVVTEDASPSEPEEPDTGLSPHEMDAIAHLVHADPVSSEREQLQKIKEAMSEESEEMETEEAPLDEVEQVSKDDLIISPSDASDEAVAATIAKMDASVEEEAAKSTTIDVDATSGDETDAEVESGDDHLDNTIERLKSRVEGMVDRIESQLDDVQGKIGDKLHFLDKDRDGILSREEMAHALQEVLKRDLSFAEAMDIAALMVSSGKI